jgi:hypothetical protein
MNVAPVGSTPSVMEENAFPTLVSSLRRHSHLLEPKLSHAGPSTCGAPAPAPAPASPWDSPFLIGHIARDEAAPTGGYSLMGDPNNVDVGSASSSEKVVPSTMALTTVLFVALVMH